MGPLLLTVCINDLTFFVPRMFLRPHADDTTGYYSDTSPTVLQFVVSSELSLLSSWFDENHLLVNNDKTRRCSWGHAPINATLFLTVLK